MYPSGIERFRAEWRASIFFRAAINREMNPRLANCPRRIRCSMSSRLTALPPARCETLEKLSVARLPHRRDWILVDNRVQREKIVGVSQYASRSSSLGNASGCESGLDSANSPNHLLEQVAPLHQPRIIHAANIGYHFGKQGGPVRVVHCQATAESGTKIRRCRALEFSGVNFSQSLLELCNMRHLRHYL